MEPTTTPTLRESLAASFDKVADTEETGLPPAAPAAPSGDVTDNQPPSTPEAPAPGTSQEGMPPADGAPSKDAGIPPAATDSKVAPTPPAAPAADISAPQSWRPETRAMFKDLPAPVRQEVLRREKDVARFVQQTAQLREEAQEFQSICMPYQNLIAMDGGNPLKTFREFLQTGTILRLGTPNEKATAIANAVREFGVDVGVLDQALTAIIQGRPMPQGQPQQQQQFKDPRLDTLLSSMEQAKTAREQEVAEEQSQLIAEFQADPKNKYFEQLRGDIADLLEFHALRGKRMSLAEAYQAAAKLHPEISKQLLNDFAAQNSQNAKQQIANKRRAAMPTPGAPVPSTAPAQGMNIRDSLEAAFEAHSAPI